MNACWPLALALALAVLAMPAAALDIVPVDPLPEATMRTAEPTLRVAFANGSVDPSSVRVGLDAFLFEEPPEGLTVNATGLAFTVPAILALSEGNHTFLVEARDAQGNPAAAAVPFVVNLTVPPTPPEPLDVRLVVGLAAGGVALLAAAATGLYLWARKRRRFTFRKHFFRHPGQLKFLVLYVPSGIAVAGTLAALYLVATLPEPPRFGLEIVLVGGSALAVGPFGVASLRLGLRTRSHERAFAQFLFELADAVRGGINPTKAVLELATTAEGVLKQPLRQAADVLRLGRPMEEALRSMAQGMESPLVSRYASLVGEASGMGGSVAGVLQRAAKDMDDLVKIKAERRRALRTPVFTMYMAFAVLLVMVLQIVSFAPNIGDLDLNALGVGDGSAQVAKMPPPVMEERFFHLLLVNAAGAGLLVGAFTDGQVRHGLLHAIAMTATAAAAYTVFVG